MLIDKTFWAERFGMLVDRFDIPWISTATSRRMQRGRKPQPADEQALGRRFTG
jgi:uncharacterized glyoxalase superfamily protein PhnB